MSTKAKGIIAGKESRPSLLVSALPVLINLSLNTTCPYLRNETQNKGGLPMRKGTKFLFDTEDSTMMREEYIDQTVR